MAFLTAAGSRQARLTRGATLAALLVLLPFSGLRSQDVHPTADQVKAVFLFNFAQFVDWPSAAFAGPASPVVIGIIGEDPFGAYLDETVRGETLRGRALVVRRFHQNEDVRRCHIVFLAQSERDRIGTILEGVKGRPILTVSDDPGFLRRGGMVGFAFERNRVRVRINLVAVTAANLTVSSKLLRAAEIVTPGIP